MTTKELSAEDVWQRAPFSLAEQLKILLIFIDGLPFRSTQQDYPNRLDVGEASALVEWPECHMHWLIHRALELELIGTRDDRFYMTERVENWENGAITVPLSESQVPFYERFEQGVTAPEWLEEEGSVSETLKGLLKPLQEQASLSINEILEWADQNTSALAGLPEEKSLEEIVQIRLEHAYSMGWVDRRLNDDEQPELVKLNKRGERWLEGETEVDASPEIDQSLPVILQPDGQLMIPLESPLSDFRQVHPYVLLTDIDNMVKYSMDQRSLINAENEGWDTMTFRNFLEERTGTIPETVEALFAESDQEAESIRVETVHHLLTFERGATTAEAMRVLSNYQPERIDENRLILRSSTTAETIKKNLSRAGIRIQMDMDAERGASPLLQTE